MSTIKYISETVSKYRDVNGNTYHYGIITRTTDGEQLRIKSLGGISNLAAIIRENDPLNAYYPETYRVECWEKAREWNHLNKQHKATEGCVYEHDRATIAEWFGPDAEFNLAKRRAKELLRNEGQIALMNPHAYTGEACGCGTCFCCAALAVAIERGIDPDTWTPENNQRAEQ